MIVTLIVSAGPAAVLRRAGRNLCSTLAAGFCGGLLAAGIARAQTVTNPGAAATNIVVQQQPAAASSNGPTRLPETTVTGRQDSMIGIAESAGQGTTGAAQLADRPILRSGEILETVPGVIITQHAGGGKANQYFLRGFNLDHGTDFANYLDGMPLNLPSHAHGEGYSDMNIVIPELVERVNYEKGPYYADVGDFGSAGAAHLDFYKTLPQNFLTVEGGMFGYERGVFGLSEKLGPGNLLCGGEACHDDGPWVHPDDYSKFNGLLTYSQGDAADGFSVTGRAYHGKWNSSDQLAENAAPLVGFFGTLNPTDGGNSGRYSLQADWHRQDRAEFFRPLNFTFHVKTELRVRKMIHIRVGREPGVGETVGEEAAIEGGIRVQFVHARAILRLIKAVVDPIVADLQAE